MDCVYKIFFSLAMAQTQLQLPAPDEFNRFQTLNGMGKVDPQTNPTVDAFVQWAAEKAPRAPEGSLYRDQMHVLEIGGGFGFVGRRILEKGAFLLFNDASPEHCEIADQFVFPLVEKVDPSQQHTLPGKFPQELDLSHLKAFFPIVGVGAFQMLHFQRPKEIRAFFDAVWDLLRPGGRFFITAGTPWNRAFRGFPSRYREKKARFLRSPSMEIPFPGEMENAWDYLPQGQYPSYFHALDGDTLSFLAEANAQKAFRVREVHRIERPIPKTQAYRRGYVRGQTELVGVILEKPGP